MSKRALTVDVDFPGVDLARIHKAVMVFRGDARQLESAMGAWILGSLIGGRGLELVHTRDVLQRYSRMLGFSDWPELRAMLPESGPKTRDLALLKLRRRFQSIVQSLVAASPSGLALLRK